MAFRESGHDQVGAGAHQTQDCAAFQCNAAMCRHKRAIRGVAPFTQKKLRNWIQG